MKTIIFTIILLGLLVGCENKKNAKTRERMALITEYFESREPGVTASLKEAIKRQRERNEPNEPKWNQFGQDCPCGVYLSSPYEGDEYKFVCSNCSREYAFAWQGIEHYLNEVKE